MDKVKVIEVIESTIARRGDGDKTPVRIITQYFTKEGKLLAEADPSPDWESDLHRLINAVKYATDYLDENNLNSIGHGSKAHNELLNALPN